MGPSELLERGEQRAAIAAALAAACSGAGSVLVIEGAAGIGKSRLLQELRQSASPQQRVLSARASELERGFAFGVVRQLFEGVVLDRDLGPRVLEGAAGPARSIFDEVPGESGPASFALLHGLSWLALNLAELGPLVLSVDDLQWCDASSLNFLAYLARRLEGSDILVAAATRPVLPALPNAELLAEFLAEPTGLRMYPQALTKSGVASLLAEQLGVSIDSEFAAACFDATEGNPLMLRQLARSLQSEGIAPTAEHATSVRRAAYRALSRTVLTRVARYSPAATAVARAVAVLGGAPHAQLVAGLAEIEAHDVTPAWSELVDAEVFTRERLEFVHALVRDAVYFDMPEPERQLLHGRAARLLDDAGEPAERVASQLALAPLAGDAWVARVLFQAGDAAMRRGAPDAAAEHLRRALAEPPPADQLEPIMAKLATALFDVDAVAAIELLRTLADRQDDAQARAAFHVGLVQALALTDRWTEAGSISRAAQQALIGVNDDMAAFFQASEGVAGTFGATADRPPPLLDAYRVLPPGATIGVRARSGQASLLWTYNGGTADQCAALASAAVGGDVNPLRDHTLVAAPPIYVLGLADRNEALELWELASEEAHRTGSVLLNLTVDLWLGFTQQRRGDLAGAISNLNESIELMEQWGSGQEPLRYARSSLALAYVDAGDPAKARTTLDALRDDLNARHSLGSLHWWHAQAWVLFAEGRLDECLAATYVLEERSAWMNTPIGLDWRLARALAQHRLGDQEAALATARDGVTLAEGWGSPGVLGPALRVLGEISGEAGLPVLERAVAVLDGSPAKIQLVRTLIMLGSALRRDRRPTEARVPLERAYELAGACGSPALVELARTELGATGVRRRPGDAAGPSALTPSERRVADLAVDGRTNREIAQALFVTPKTVEVHLSATYRKLGIASRHALSGALESA